MNAPLYDALAAALSTSWRTTGEMRDLVATRYYVPNMPDVAATLRQLRRDGIAERRTVGDSRVAYWRKLEGGPND